MSCDALKGIRLLIVEDEALVAMMIHDVMHDAGAQVIGPAVTIERALAEIAGNTIDCALLDVNLAGQRVDRVADELIRRGIPFIFLTGYGQSGIAERFPQIPVVAKPFEDENLLQIVSDMVIALRNRPALSNGV